MRILVRSLLRVAAPALVSAAVALSSCAPQPARPVGPEEIATLRTSGPNVAVNGRLAVDGMRIRNRDYIETGPESYAQINFDTGGFVLLNEHTDPFFEQYTGPGSCVIEFTITLGAGYGESGKCSFRALTEYLDSVVFSSFLVEAERQEARFWLLEGTAAVERPMETRLGRRQTVRATQTEFEGPRAITDAELSLILDWVEAHRITRPLPSPPPPAPALQLHLPGFRDLFKPRPTPPPQRRPGTNLE